MPTIRINHTVHNTMQFYIVDCRLQNFQLLYSLNLQSSFENLKYLSVASVISVVYSPFFQVEARKWCKCRIVRDGGFGLLSL
jgi:hypothetical protein